MTDFSFLDELSLLNLTNLKILNGTTGVSTLIHFSDSFCESEPINVQSKT